MSHRCSPPGRFLLAFSALLFGPSLLSAGVDVKVNADAAGTVQNEVRLTQNPTDAMNFAVAYNDTVGTSSSPLGVSFSLDGGTTWADRQLGIPLHLVVGGPDDGIALPVIFDPFIDSDSAGNLFAGYIATDGSAGGPGGLYLEQSSDKGATWSGPINISFDLRAPMMPPPPPAPDPYRFNDRCDMTVDGSDSLYVVWIKDVGQGFPTSDIYFAKSPSAATGLDFTGGAGSVAPQTVNDTPGGMPGPPGMSDFANVPDVAVATDGTVYVSWIDTDVTVTTTKPGTLHLDRSTDGGVTFGMDQTAQSITAIARNLSTLGGAGTGDDARGGSYSAIGTDPAASATVYLVYTAVGLGVGDDADIFFTRSTMSGATATWSAPLLVNDDGTIRDQFNPMMTVKSDGTIVLAWYDKRLAANDDQWDVYTAKSTDGGVSFSANVRVTDSSFGTPTDTGGGAWLGEYLGLTVDGSNAYFAFTSSIAPDTLGDVYFDSRLVATIPVELQSFAVE